MSEYKTYPSELDFSKITVDFTSENDSSYKEKKFTATISKEKGIQLFGIFNVLNKPMMIS